MFDLPKGDYSWLSVEAAGCYTCTSNRVGCKTVLSTKTTGKCTFTAGLSGVSCADEVAEVKNVMVKDNMLTGQTLEISD